MNNNLKIILISLGCSVLSLVIYVQFIAEENSPVRSVILQKENFAKKVLDDEYYAPDKLYVSSFVDAAKKVRPCVVHITNESGDRYERIFGGEASGSGVIVSEDGYIMTNNHVIADAKELNVTLSNKKTYGAKIIGTDKTTDLALIKIKDTERKTDLFPFLKFADSDEVDVGEWVLAIGNPFNLNSTVTAGIVSAKGRNIDILDGQYDIESFIQTDAVVNPGNSGGALVDTEGDLVGINTAIITRSGRYEGYSFAVPSNLVYKVMTDLMEFGSVQRGFLGVTINDITEEIALDYDLKTMQGVFIQGVGDNSAADEAGIKRGDVIIKVNDVEVSSSPELQEEVGMYRPGDKLSIIFIRKGDLKSTEVTLKNSINTTSLSSKRNPNRFKEADQLLNDLGIEIGIFKDENKVFAGIEIKKISAKSIISETNMEAGFIVTEINGKTIHSEKDFLESIIKASSEVNLKGFYEIYSGEYTYMFDKENY